MRIPWKLRRGLHERLAESRLGRILPRGVCLPQDLRSSLGRLRVDVVFDVGANKGQSAKRFLRWFPEAAVYCFEPLPEAFQKLEESLAGRDRAECFEIGLGARRGDGRIQSGGSTATSRLIPAGSTYEAPEARQGSVRIETLDHFCEERDIGQVGFLKIDTEGGDLEVLRGGQGLLEEQGIDVLQVEAGMNSRNDLQVPLEDFKAYLEPRSYFLFAIYEQIFEWPTGEPHLRRGDAVFISERLIRAHRRGAG